MAFTQINQGSFTSTGAGVRIPLPSSADYFRVENLTQLATTQNPGRGVMFEWFKDLTAQQAAIRWGKLNSANTLEMTQVTSGGFTYVTSFPAPEAAVTGTAITAANPAVATINNSYSNGDKVVVYGTTGMLQISGMVLTVSSVSATNVTFAGLPAGGFAAPATALTTRRLSPLEAVEPAFLYVTAISQASSAVVTVSTAHNYVVGMKVKMSVPSSFGMVEMDGLTGTITAVGTYTLTLDIDSSAFSAFAFPASSASPTAPLFATAAPAGQSTQFDPITLVQTGYNTTFAPFHTGLFIPYMFLAAGAQSPAGSSGDSIVWQAYKKEA